MTHHDHSPHDDADRLDEALDALMRGDHSGLDELPPDMAATVSRLMWLSHEGAIDSEAAPSDTRSSKPMGSLIPRSPFRPIDRSRPVHPHRLPLCR